MVGVPKLNDKDQVDYVVTTCLLESLRRYWWFDWVLGSQVNLTVIQHFLIVSGLMALLALKASRVDWIGSTVRQQGPCLRGQRKICCLSDY